MLAATINGFPLSTAKITEKRKIIEEIALADVKKVRHQFSHVVATAAAVLLRPINYKGPYIVDSSKRV